MSPFYHGLFASEYDYRPVDLSQVPYGDFAVAFSRSHNVRRVLHNYGAIQCLERLLGLVRDDGFILANDYGPTQLSSAEEYEHQHFSEATAIGVNFPQLKAYFTDAKPHRWIEPAGERESIHARLLAHQPAPETIARFEEGFGKAAWDRAEEPARRARELLRAGRLEAAASAFRQALAGQPHNWVLLNEVALFLTFTLRDPRAGADLAKLALAENPTSAELWNTLGDCLFEWGRNAEARQAYRRAEQLSASSVRARYNLAWVHIRERDYAAALAKLAEALALDWTGEYRERLFQKQQEVLALLTQRHQQEYLRLANRISTAGSGNRGPTA
jgi:tetratricopeptide (TPR) repeat protein